MNTAKKILTHFMLVLVPCIVMAQGMDMSEYQKMAEGLSKNYPKELEPLMPKGYTVKGKNIAFAQTQSMFLVVGMQGTRKNEAYPKFGHETELKVMVLAANPATAGFMGAQFPMMVQMMQQGYMQAETDSNGDYVYDPMTVQSAGGVNVYVRKLVRKNVEIENRKHQDQVYYNAQAVALVNNMMWQFEVLYYSGTPEALLAMIADNIRFVQATDFSKYMK